MVFQMTNNEQPSLTHPPSGYKSEDDLHKELGQILVKVIQDNCGKLKSNDGDTLK